MSKKVITEALRPVELYQVDRLALRQKLDDALTRVTRKLDKNIVAFGDKFPGEACENGIWPRSENVEWTTSFWPGQLWLAWEMSGNPAYREAAERYLPSFARRIRSVSIRRPTIWGFSILSPASAHGDSPAMRPPARARCWPRKR